MEPYDNREAAKVPEGASRDKKRLAVGIGFMALLLVGTLVCAFLLGTPAEGHTVAVGVPLLILVGWAAVLASTITFYRLYRGR